MNNQNLWRALLLTAIALYFLVQSPGLSIGDFGRPGPGLFPAVVSVLLLAICVVMLARARLIERVPIDFRFQNIAIIAASLIAFALISEYVNMFTGIVVMVTMASYTSEDFSIQRTAAIAASLCLVAYAMKRGLGVNLPLY